MPGFDLDTLRAFAEEGIARHGLRGYARKMDLDIGTLRSLRDGRDIQVSKLMRILDAMQLELHLSGGQDAPANRPLAASVKGFGEASHETTISAPDEALRQGFLPIPFHPASGIYDGLAYVAFARAWLAENSCQPEALSFLSAPDDRLAPAISRGALCLIDNSVRNVSSQAVWAHLEDGQLRLDLLSQPQPGVMVTSGLDPADTPVVRSGPELDNVNLLGRVVWVGTCTAQCSLNRIL